MEAYEICLPCGQIMTTMKVPELLLFGFLVLIALFSLFTKFNIVSMLAKVGRIVQGGQRGQSKPKSKGKARRVSDSSSSGKNL